MEGDYPKDFCFSGWHPHCFCYAIPILVDEAEMAKVTSEFLEGREYAPQGKVVTELPEGFRKWVAENSARIRGAKSLPYWVTENPRYLDGKKGVVRTTQKKSYKLIPRESLYILSEKENIMQLVENWSVSMSEKQRINAETIYKSMNPKEVRITPMSIIKADSGSCNPMFAVGKNKKNSAKENYNDNCVCCVVTYEMRRRGMDVTALSYEGDKLLFLGDRFQNAFVNSAGNIVAPIVISGKDIIKLFHQKTQSDGRYVIGLNRGESGHVFLFEKVRGKEFAYDPQTDSVFDAYSAIRDMDYVEILKIDKLLLNQECANYVARPLLRNKRLKN